MNFFRKKPRPQLPSEEPVEIENEYPYYFSTQFSDLGFAKLVVLADKLKLSHAHVIALGIHCVEYLNDAGLIVKEADGTFTINPKKP